MSTVYFKGKDGQVTSTRSGNSNMRITRYTKGSAGGVTFKFHNMTARFNSKGQCIGTGIKSGDKTTYFGKNGNVTSNITAFR